MPHEDLDHSTCTDILGKRKRSKSCRNVCTTSDEQWKGRLDSEWKNHSFLTASLDRCVHDPSNEKDMNGFLELMMAGMWSTVCGYIIGKYGSTSYIGMDRKKNGGQ